VARSGFSPGGGGPLFALLANRREGIRAAHGRRSRHSPSGEIGPASCSSIPGASRVPAIQPGGFCRHPGSTAASRASTSARTGGSSAASHSASSGAWAPQGRLQRLRVTDVRRGRVPGRAVRRDRPRRLIVTAGPRGR